ncbi:MAG: 3-oxoacyl-ACP reductase FabG [Acidobacteria bacterium]|jgi:NAD(P)-dependent dehydrogenase (short-subunit alcohol dehydrogenase family)|nr:3-oxoacyl-ACP reductase FabG [Acidobacteriota bacterium]
MKVDLQGRIAVVTGAAGGIGRAIALLLSENGATVAVNDVSDRGVETCREIEKRGGVAKFFPGDVGNAESVNAMAAAVEQDLGPVDILINNAGINTGKDGRHPVHEFGDAAWRRILSIDLDGVFFCSRVFSGGMVKRGRGVIVNIGSVLGLVPIRLQCAYSAAKAGMLNFTRSHALEVGGYGVRVNGVAPGSILTEGTKDLFYKDKQLSESLLSHVPLARPGDTKDIANAVLFLVSDEASYVTGHVLVVDGGWTAGFAREW